MTLFWGVILQTCGLHTERPSTFELGIHLYYNATGCFKQTCRFILYYELVSTVNQPVLTAQVHCDHQDCKNRNKQMIPELGQLIWLVTKCLSGCCRRKSLIFFQLTHSQFQRLEQFFFNTVQVRSTCQLRAFQCHYHSWRFIETECLTCLTKVCICLQSLRCYREVGGLGVGESRKNGGGGVGEKQSQTRPKWTQTLPERGNVCECGCVQSNSANIVLQFTIDMVICVNSDFQQHHMESQMCSQQWPYQDKFWFPLCPAAIPPLLLFLFPYPHPLPSVLSLSLSCLCFACRSEVRRGCCIHFQFPLCGGIPLVITFSFPTLAPCAKFEQLGPEFSKTVTRHRVPTRTPLGPGSVSP